MNRMNIAHKSIFAFGIASVALLLSCSSVDKKVTLKDAFKSDFYIGTALDSIQICSSDSSVTNLITSQFSSVVAENTMKWERIHPQPNVYDFVLPDKFVAFGQANKMFIIGHCLLWHSQVAPYVFLDNKGNTISKDSLLIRLKDHITTIMTRYKGKINGYDVVNEALNEDGTMRESNWYKILGDDYIEKAFEFAHAADPDAQLYYNDYNIEQPEKRAGVLRIVKRLKDKGIRIDGVGIQGHWHLDKPSVACVDSSISEFAKLGVKVMITEFDISVLPHPENHSGANISDNFEMTKEMNPYTAGLPDSIQQQLAKRYADFFTVYVKHKKEISRVTFWGVHDGQSWLNGWPIRGRTNYPLLFDRKLQPKPAFYEVIKVASSK